MKPQITWQTPVQYLKSVGPVKARALARLGIATAGDLLTHYPRKYFDRSEVTPIAKLPVGREATVEGHVLTAGERRTRRGGTVQTVSIQDPSGVLFCVWFNQRYLVKQFKSGLKVMCSGLVQHHAGRKQMAHPDFELHDAAGDRLHTGRLVPQYPATQGIGQHWLRRLVHATLEQVVGELNESLPDDLIARRGLTARSLALRGMHFPRNRREQQASRRRLAYEELFLVQLTMALRRKGKQNQPGLQLQRPGDLTRRFVASLPFQLTGAQRRVLKEILADLRSGRVMHRLLQGDVGSGKTLVALIAALFVIEQGYHAVLMAPTEVLARQHGKTCHDLTRSLDLAVETLTGATPAAQRRAILTGARQGKIDLLVGTHALLQDEVYLPDLGLAVVDEQHRFGVLQRGRTARSSDPGPAPHVLVMSATPIPRSLSLTLYGDLDLSVIDELPRGRKAVLTHLMGEAEAAKVWQHVRRAVAEGQQAYVIYPVIEETAGQDLKAATVEYERLGQGPLASVRLALLHGRLKPREKDAIMTAFAAGELDVLVATTVIEVGVDVANATVMVITHPERFGLAQLHQLRGRVGRGEHQSHCYLITDRWLAPETRERILFFCSHHDGFQLAEEDLRLRGPGDILGVRQHGLPGFQLANPLQDNELVKSCRQDVEYLIASDPRLEAAGHASLRRTLHDLYGRLLPLRAG